MGTAIRERSLRRWFLVIVGVTITAAFGALGFARKEHSVSQEDSPHLAAEIKLSHLINVLHDRSVDSARTDDTSGEPKWVARFARSDLILKQVMRNGAISSQPQIFKAQDPKDFVRRNLKVTIPDAELIRFEFGSGTELERAAVANVVVDILLKELDQRENMARARLIADNEKARFDIRVKRVDFSRAEQELKNRIGSEQGEDVSAGLAFPLGLRERHGELTLKKIEIDSQLAARNEVKDADDNTLRELSKSRRAVTVELEQIKKSILEEAAHKRDNEGVVQELMELQARICDLTALEETYSMKGEQLGLHIGTRWGRYKDAVAAGQVAND